MQTLATRFRGQQIFVHRHFPHPAQNAGGDWFELAGAEPGDGSTSLGEVVALAVIEIASSKESWPTSLT